MENNEKITVIIPVYNAEKYLEQCVNSVLSQTYTNLEVLLVNDGSTDSSAYICEQYKEKDSRVRVHHKKNGGVSTSRNRALELVTGDYIVFIDCDDWMEPGHIESLYNHLKETESDIVVVNFVKFSEETRAFLIHTPSDKQFEGVYTVDEWFKYQYEWQFCMSQCFTVPWGKIYKRHLFDDIVYPVGEKVEDDYTTYKVYLKANKIAFLQEGSYIHRKSNTSITKSVDLIHVFPLRSIEERITILSLLGKDISRELDAYKYRLEIHRKSLLESGNIDAYKQVINKIKLLEYYGK